VAVSGGGAVEVMHVRDIAVDSATGDVFFTAYGGPSAAHIVRCIGAQRCSSIRKFDYSATAQLLPSAIAFSSKLNRVFYAVADGSLERSVIYSSQANGDDVREYVVQTKETGVAFPVGLAIDDVNGFVYWANDVGPDRVQRGDLAIAAENVGTLYKKTDIRPFQIAVDPVGKFLYYVDQSSAPNAIGRIRTDLIDSHEQLRALGSLAPHDIALDIDGKNVYWSEVGTSIVAKGSVVDLGVAPSSSAASMALAGVVVMMSIVSMNF
jgi:DNA-binding beta-propeller fold protein YncE